MLATVSAQAGDDSTHARSAGSSDRCWCPAADQRQHGQRIRRVEVRAAAATTNSGHPVSTEHSRHGGP